ncbi:DsbA family protein [Nocardioides sp. NPDC101246]|uniref:DsbA family protein n=1 Tax=Nocardioides sp. NPDC101246 TaxID=3364336 RepID=UPI003825005F
MSKQTKITAVVAGLVIAAIVALIVASSRGEAERPAPAADTPAEENALTRPDARMLGEKGSSDVTFVEFLDFECEACGAAYPIVEDIRKKYAGEVTFVVRYFPLPGHFNSERAARAVESAGRQGQFEAMYSKMYETQATWGEARTPHDDLFRSFAEEIGLDMKTYDADYASEEVAARVQRDIDDGTELGVQGTPTFFVDGEPFQPQTAEDFDRVLDEALAQ